MTDTGRSVHAIEAGWYRAVLGHFASGVVIVTSMADGHPVGMTCQSFFSVSLEPPLIAISPGKGSTSWPSIASAGFFCVNVLSSAQEALARTFAMSGADKFAGVGWHPTGTGAPLLDGALAWMDCSIEATYEAGDHWLILGQVHDLDSGSGEPLVFYRAGFGTYAP